MKAPALSQSQMNTLSGYIQAAGAAISSGNNAAALGYIIKYYSAQTNVRGYASDALSVINNQGLFGIAANQDVIQAIGLDQYNNIKTTLIYNLSYSDYLQLQSNNGFVSTESQISSYHYYDCASLGIPQTAFGGAADAGDGGDAVGGQGGIEKPELRHQESFVVWAGHLSRMRKPPSTLMAAPMMKAASSEAR